MPDVENRRHVKKKKKKTTLSKLFEIQILIAMFGLSVENVFQMSSNQPSIGLVVLAITSLIKKDILQNLNTVDKIKSTYSQCGVKISGYKMMYN